MAIASATARRMSHRATAAVTPIRSAKAVFRFMAYNGQVLRRHADLVPRATVFRRSPRLPGPRACNLWVPDRCNFWLGDGRLMVARPACYPVCTA